MKYDIVQINISDLKNIREVYDFNFSHTTLSSKDQTIEITKEKVLLAVKEGRFCEIPFQDLDRVNEYFRANSKDDKEVMENYEKLHVERVAHYYANQSALHEHPIHVKLDGVTILDGNHRILAAKYSGVTQLQGIKFENNDKSVEWHRVNSQ